METRRLTPELAGRLQEALDRSPGVFTWDDVLGLLQTGAAQLWSSEDAAIVTQVENGARGGMIHFWLAGGTLEAVVALSKAILVAAQTAGIHKASLIGRPGWVRALRNEGWRATDLVIMEWGGEDEEHADVGPEDQQHDGSR